MVIFFGPTQALGVAVMGEQIQPPLDMISDAVEFDLEISCVRAPPHSVFHESGFGLLFSHIAVAVNLVLPYELSQWHRAKPLTELE